MQKMYVKVLTCEKWTMSKIVTLLVITMMILAPAEQPAVTPISDGSASGFLNKPWRAAPHIAKMAPTQTVRATLGARMENKISLSVARSGFPEPVIISKHCEKLIHSAPLATEKKSQNGEKRKSAR